MLRLSRHFEGSPACKPLPLGGGWEGASTLEGRKRDAEAFTPFRGIVVRGKLCVPLFIYLSIGFTDEMQLMWAYSKSLEETTDHRRGCTPPASVVYRAFGAYLADSNNFEGRSACKPLPLGGGWEGASPLGGSEKWQVLYNLFVREIRNWTRSGGVSRTLRHFGPSKAENGLILNDS